MLHNGRCGSTVVGNLLAQNPNMHWASELYTPLFAKWKKEHPNRFPLSEQKTIVEKPIEFLKNSISETTKPYYGVVIKPVQCHLHKSRLRTFLPANRVSTSCIRLSTNPFN